MLAAPQGFSNSPSTAAHLASLKWAVDYLMACHTSASAFVAQVCRRLLHGNMLPLCLGVWYLLGYLTLHAHQAAVFSQRNGSVQIPCICHFLHILGLPNLPVTIPHNDTFTFASFPSVLGVWVGRQLQLMEHCMLLLGLKHRSVLHVTQNQ